MYKPLFLLLIVLGCISTHAQYRHDSLKINNSYLHFYTKGSGKPIVFLQGGPGFSSYYMRAIADSFQGNQCILIDYEGTGRSVYRKADTNWVSPEKVVADVEAVRQHLGIQQWMVLGHSYGTHFGLYYAVQHPLQVSKIILVSSIGTSNAFQRYSNDNAMVRLTEQDMQQAMRIERDSTLNAVDKEFAMQSIFLKSYFFNKDKIPPFLQSVPASEKPIYFNNDFFSAYFDQSRFWKWDIAEQVYALQQPVLIIQGRQDFLNDGKQEIMNLHMKHSQLRYIERSGHFPWLEQPGVFFEMVREAIK